MPWGGEKKQKGWKDLKVMWKVNYIFFKIRRG
jgi:hypothetical protein